MSKTRMIKMLLRTRSLMVKCMGCEVRSLDSHPNFVCYLTLSFPVYKMQGMVVATPQSYTEDI